MIEAKRVYIRPIQYTDANAIFAYRSLECVAQYQYWEPFTMQKSLDFVEQNSCLDISAKGVWIGLAIILKSSNELIGDCALKIDGRKAELGCNISPKHQRHGYAQDALNLLIDMCFEEFEVSEVFGITDSENLSSVKLMQSLGMNKIEAFENKLLCKGRLSVEYKYYINKNQMKITDDVSLRPLQVDDAKDIYNNTPSSNISKRLGFQFEGVERAGELFANGEFVDIEIYSLLKNDK